MPFYNLRVGVGAGIESFYDAILSVSIIFFFTFLPYLSSYTMKIFFYQVKIKACVCEMPKHLKNTDSRKLLEEIAN